METALQLAIVTALFSFLGAWFTFHQAKSAERRDKLQQRKLEHYGQLMVAISDLASDCADQKDANLRFERAVNTIVLVAPQPVVRALMEFHNEIRISNEARTQQATIGISMLWFWHYEKV